MNDVKPLILIVEDDEDMALLNTRLLNRHGYETLIAFTAKQARLLAASHTPDLFVLDIELPDGNGMALCREFRASSDAPVMFLSGKSESSDKIMGLGLGGDYYLTKPYDRNEFVAVVQSLLRRAEQTKKKIDEVTVITKGSLTLKLNEGKAYVNDRDAELTQKEYALLLLLVQNDDKEVSSEQLYQSVWGMPMNNDANAVRLHISRLKKKIGSDDSPDFTIFTEYGKGYTFSSFSAK